MPKMPHFSRGLAMASSLPRFSVLGFGFAVKFMGLGRTGKTLAGNVSLSTFLILLDKLFFEESRPIIRLKEIMGHEIGGLPCPRPQGSCPKNSRPALPGKSVPGKRKILFLHIEIIRINTRS